MITVMSAASSDSLTTAVTNALSQIITWVGTVITAVIGDNGALNALLPLFAIGIGISVLLFGIKAIRSVVWGA